MAEVRIDEKTLVLLAAAATAALGDGKKVRVKRIRLIHHGSTTWRDQGRVSIHTSHSIWKHQS